MSSHTLGMSEPLRGWYAANGYREPASLAALRVRTAELSNARMQISPEQGAFMAMVVGMIGARRTVEVGTFTGYSALAVALALPDSFVTGVSIPVGSIVLLVAVAAGAEAKQPEMIKEKKEEAPAAAKKK